MRMRRLKILDHEVERGVSAGDLLLREDHQVRASAKLENTNVGPLEYGTHSQLQHEGGGVVHAIRFEDDVPHPDGRPRILVAHEKFSTITTSQPRAIGSSLREGSVYCRAVVVSAPEKVVLSVRWLLPSDRTT